jgi:hypothetical protein
MDGGAISTTGRRSTTRPCNLSRGVTQSAVLRGAFGAGMGKEMAVASVAGSAP